MEHCSEPLLDALTELLCWLPNMGLCKELVLDAIVELQGKIESTFFKMLTFLFLNQTLGETIPMRVTS